MAKTYEEQTAVRKRVTRGKARPNVVYRILKWNDSTQTYRLIPGKEDVTLHRVGIRWTEEAALAWAAQFASPEESEIHLMVTRFSCARIAEAKLITLTREPNPWVPKSEPDDEDDDPFGP